MDQKILTINKDFKKNRDRKDLLASFAMMALNQSMKYLMIQNDYDAQKAARMAFAQAEEMMIEYDFCEKKWS